MSKSIPPEAYTKSELAKAMSWRDQQTEHIKSITNSPEALISLFKRTQRNKNTNLEFSLDGKSSGKFTNELSNFSDKFKPQLDQNDYTFDESAPSSQIDSTKIGHTKSASTRDTSIKNASPKNNLEETQTFDFNHDLVSTATKQNIQHSVSADVAVDLAPGLNITEQVQPNLDPESLIAIKNAKDGFNLSNDTEAIRLLIKIGYKNIQSIIED